MRCETPFRPHASSKKHATRCSAAGTGSDCPVLRLNISVFPELRLFYILKRLFNLHEYTRVHVHFHKRHVLQSLCQPVYFSVYRDIKSPEDTEFKFGTNLCLFSPTYTYCSPSSLFLSLSPTHPLSPAHIHALGQTRQRSVY